MTLLSNLAETRGLDYGYAVRADQPRVGARADASAPPGAARSRTRRRRGSVPRALRGLRRDARPAAAGAPDAGLGEGPRGLMWRRACGEAPDRADLAEPGAAHSGATASTDRPSRAGLARQPRRRGDPHQVSRLLAVQTVLVANRGEIALRVFRAARALGLGTVAVVAPDDTGSLHARSADETVEIGSYLHSEEHIRAALASGADAVHPGYGFLAENADFAEAVEAAGLTWIGPPPDALRRGGDKLEAKRIAAEAGVPTIPEVDRAAADREGSRGRRRPRHARRAHRRGARARARSRQARGAGRLRRRPRLPRALPRAAASRRDPAARRLARHGARARRARVLGAAPPPEGARGVAVDRARPRAARAR